MKREMEKHLSELLGKTTYYSYIYTWIFLGSLFLTQYIHYFSSMIAQSNIVISSILAFCISLLIEKTLGTSIKNALIWFTEHSYSPEDKRLYGLFDGWTVFLTAIIVLVVCTKFFNIMPPFEPGPYVFLIPLSSGILFASIVIGLIIESK